MANYAVLVKGNIGPIDRLFPASTKPLTKHGDPLLFQSSSHMNKRPRRLRFTPRMRSLTRENHVSTEYGLNTMNKNNTYPTLLTKFWCCSDFVYPLFIHDDEPSTKPSLGRAQKDPIHSMPGIYRHNLASMMEEVRESVRLVQLQHIWISFDWKLNSTSLWYHSITVSFLTWNWQFLSYFSVSLAIMYLIYYRTHLLCM